MAGVTGTATLLFADLVKSTEVLGRLGDTAADHVREAHLSLMRAAVHAHGGEEVKNLGDGVMAAFGSAVDAVRAAIAIEQRIARRKQSDGDTLDVRVGLDVGDVLQDGGDYFGTPVVVASRLCAAAGGGQILASDLVRALAGTRADVDFRPLGTLALKGFHEPVAACEVEWEAVEPEPAVPATMAIGAEPFVGREAELERMRSWWSSHTTSTSVIAVGGEPGIGKSRLAAEFARAAADSGATVVYGRCIEDGGVAYQPLVEALGPAVFERMAAVSRLSTPAVGGLAGDEAVRFDLLEAMADALAAAGGGGPVVAVFDDLHWSDAATLRFLRHFMASRARGPVLVVLTYRETEVDARHPLSDLLAAFVRDDVAERIVLRGLATEDLAEVVPRDIAERSGGNPLFARELARDRAEGGDTVGVPERIHDVIGRRLARLDDECARLLRVASVLGQEFVLDAAAVVGERSEDVATELLDAAVASGIVRETAFGRFSFTHALVRDTLYNSLTETRRVRLHRRAGDVLAIDESTPASVLAHHYGEALPAGTTEEFVEHARRAATEAFQSGAAEEAVAYLDRALDAMVAADRRDRDYGDVVVDLVEVLWFVDSSRGRVLAREALEHARALGDAELLARAAASYPPSRPVGELDEEVLEVVEEALAAVGQEDSPVTTALLGRQGAVLFWGGDIEKVEAISRRALDMARRTGDRAALAGAAYFRWYVLSGMDPTVGLELADECPRDASIVASSASSMRIHAHLAQGSIGAVRNELRRWQDQPRTPNEMWLTKVVEAQLALIAGDFAGAKRIAREHREYGVKLWGSDALGVTAFTAYALQNLQWRREEDRVADLIDSTRNFGEMFPAEKAWTACLAVELCQTGRVDEAASVFGRLAAEGFTDLPRTSTWFYVLCLAAESAAAVGASEAAAAIYEHLLPHAGIAALVLHNVSPVCLGSIARYVGLAAATSGQLDEADEHFASALAFNERLESPPWLAHTAADWAVALDLRGGPGDGDRASELRARARHIGERLGMVALLRRLGT